MTSIVNNILPILLIFALGYGCKRTGLLTKDNADLLLKIFFYLVLPSVILLSFSETVLTLHMLVLPMLAIVLFACSYSCSRLVHRRLTLPPQSLGVFFIGAITLNGSFLYPFVFSFYGQEGMVVAYLFDFGNAMVSFSFAYYLACHYGSRSTGLTRMAIYKKFLLSPPLLALTFAILLNLCGIKIPSIGLGVLKIMSGMTTPLIMLSLGIYFSPRIVKPAPLLAVIVIRLGGGLLFGYLLVTLFQLSGTTRLITMIMALSPSAMNTLIYASLEGLDKELAASIISYTTVISMLLISAMILILH